jgi:hypothetical protein
MLAGGTSSRVRSDAAHAAHAAERRRGSAMVAILVALMALQMVVAVLVLSGARSDDLTARSIAGLRAQYAGDAALNMALREAFLNLDEDGDGSIGGVSGDALASNDPAIGAARASVTATLVGGDRTLSVSARSDEAQRSASATVRAAVASGSGLRRGLRIDGWEFTSSPSSISGINWNATPTVTGMVPWINNPPSGSSRWTGGSSNRFALRLTGRITVPAAGTWTFGAWSDDGVELLINGTQVAIQNGPRGFAVSSGNINLAAGAHDIEVRFFEAAGQNGLTLTWSGPTVPTSVLVPPSAFSHDPTGQAHVAIRNTIGIWGDNTSSGASIDAFNSATGPYSTATALSTGALVVINSSASQAWQMFDQAILRGDAGVAPGANPSSVITTWSGSSITGTRTDQQSLHDVFHVTPPALSSSGAFNSGGTHTVTANRRYSSFQFWGNGSTFTITGDVTMVVDGDMQLSDSARIIVSPGSILTLFVAGNLDVLSASMINATGAPDQCFIFMTGSSRNFNMSDQAQVVAHLRAWDAQANISGQGSGSDFFGTLRATTLNLSAKARIHADINTGNGGNGGGGGGTTRRITGISDGPLF